MPSSWLSTNSKIARVQSLQSEACSLHINYYLYNTLIKVVECHPPLRLPAAPRLKLLIGTLRQTMLKLVTATMAVLVIFEVFLHMGLVGL
jgi:hypothetical protein